MSPSPGEKSGETEQGAGQATVTAGETFDGNSEGGARISIAAQPIIGCIFLYRRWISPLFPSVCRFRPTCSEYALRVIRDHGLFRGGWFAFRRVLHCNPWHPGGYDPPPPPRP